MTDEEKKAIERLNKYIKEQKEEFNMFGYITTLEIDLKNTETILNLIENQKAELEKKDKIIDEMAETLRYYNGMKQEQCFCIDICGEKECDMKNCKDIIKQYFEKKVGINNDI